MDFSEALISLKAGFRVYREGWTGTRLGSSEELPKMFLALQKGYPNGIPINKNTSEAIGAPEGTMIRFNPYLVLSLPDGSIEPYVPSNNDLLADDWKVK